MKALVTGATGFIGSHLVEELIKKGYDVTCLVRKTSNLKWIEGLKVALLYGDCGDEGSLARIPSDLSYVFHLAGLTKAREEGDFFCVNTKGTENLLMSVSVKAKGMKRFIHLSSLAAAGPSRNGASLDETCEPKPVSSYGKSKLESEGAIMRFKGALPATIIRPPAVYGPRDKDFHVLFKILKKGFYPHWGKCYYSLLYVDDLVRGLIMAAEEKEAEGGIYFLSDGNVYSNEDIANEIVKVLDSRAVKIRIPTAFMSLLAKVNERVSKDVSIISRDRLKDMKYTHWTCDPSKARKDFRFVPKVTIKEGIKWTADWYRIHQWL
ncbi:MAG: NAD-dependent epimerase/dehydratase family protein [Nitrospirae bacterium]|nr:NAD-dependent epimerase/dehydratase family protein [Nitrospirota bacterium]